MKNTFEFYNKHYNKSTFCLMKEQRGITLIALIVTIVVLLIVAGITIVNIRGGDKTIDKAQDAKIQHEKSDITERIQAAVLSSATPEGDFVLEDVKSAITQNVNNATFLNNQFPLNVQVDSNRYYVDAEGQVDDTGYVEKEYLKSTGTQYIDTLYNATGNTKVDVKFQFEKNNSLATILGARELLVNSYILVDGSNNNKKLYYYYGNNNDHNTSKQDIEFGKTYTAYCSNNKAEVKNIETIGNDTYVDFNINYTLYLFALNESGTAKIFGKDVRIYYCKIYEGDTLVRDFIPVLSLENSHENEPCLYDQVENKFYYNQGSGTFETD